MIRPGAGLFASMILCLAGCAGERPPIYPDICESGRRFSDREKIDATLKFIHANIEYHRLQYYKKGDIGRYIAKYKNPEEFSSQYVKDFPSCCVVVRPPTYVSYYSAQRAYQAEEELIGVPGSWVADVDVKKTIAQNPKSRPYPDFKVSGCNEVSFIERG